MLDEPVRSVAPETERAYREAGFWTDASLGQLLDRYLARMTDQVFSVRSARRAHRGLLAEVDVLSRRVARGLQARGIGPGDVVSFQLPNWTEAAAVFWGAARAGAVLVPVVHFYGARELGYILAASGSRLHVTADRFGHLDHLSILTDLRSDLDGLEHVYVVGDETGASAPAGSLGWSEPFERLADHEPLAEPVAVDPAAPALVAFTSGTTADPKGVIHTHRSIGAEVRQLGDMRGSGDHPMLVGAPVGHAIGMLSGLLLPLHRGHPVHLIDTWDPAAVLAAMADDGLNGGSGATYFLTSLLDHPDCGPEHLRLMERVGLGGAPVPAAVADRAEALGVSVVRSFGCTEHPSITGARHDDPAEKRKYTDGRAMPGVEIRLVDGDGREVAAGEPGEILSRGPDLFGGYTDAALTERTVDADGWYHTGDVGVVDADGWLRITDRKSDVIIRGGENISAAEVEELLARLPTVAEVAVVAAPDERLGEHACAFLRPATPGEALPALDDVRRHLEAAGLARQKWPEEIRAIDDFPRTPSGKIKKYVLRDRLHEESV